SVEGSGIQRNHPLTLTLSQRERGQEQHFLASTLWAILAGIAMTVATFMTWATLCIACVFAIYALLQLLFDWRRGVRTVAMLLLATSVFVACNYILYRT